MPDLSRLSQREVSEYVLARLGLHAPHGDALDLIDLEREASPRVRESLRRAVVELLERQASASGALSLDAAADLLTLAAFLLDPAHPMDPSDRGSAVRSLCRLADAEAEEVARRSRGVLLALHAPGTADFWLGLAQSARHPPEPATVLEGLSQVGFDEAYRYLASQLAEGLAAARARDLLVDLLRGLDPPNRIAARDGFLRFLDSGLDEVTRLQLSEAPSLAGLDWTVREPPRRARFVSLLRRWRSLDATVEDPRGPRFDALRAEIVGLLGDVFPLFEADQLPVVYDGLTAHLMTPAGDRLAVESMAALHLEDELARRVLAQLYDRSWELAEWYLRVSEWVQAAKAREELVAALYRALATGERTPFLYQILLKRPEAPEIMLNSAIDPEHVFKMEAEFTGGYTTPIGTFERFESVTE